MIRFLAAFLILMLAPAAAMAQDLQEVLAPHKDEIASPSRRTVGVVLDALVQSGHPDMSLMLQFWQEKALYQRDSDGYFYRIAETGETVSLLDIATGEVIETDVAPDGLSQLKPNGGVRRVIGEALVRFQLSDPDPDRRRQALVAISRGLDESQLEPLLASIETENDAQILAIKERLATYLLARFGAESGERVGAINGLSGDLSVETRAVLSQILRTRLLVAETLPADANLARILQPGTEALSRDDAYSILVEEADLPAIIEAGEVRAALETHVEGGRVGGLPVAALDNWDARFEAYDALAIAGTVPPRVTEREIDAALAAWVIAEVYVEPDVAVTDAAAAAQKQIETRVGVSRSVDLGLDAISLASIYFLAAIGLAITFGVMGVINMAHGEFIMMGAYTGYIVQQFVPNYTVSLIVALPLAFAVTFAAGVLMERSVIRWLYNRPLETLLATFGISIALQQLAKNIFGTQARPLTSPGWLDGAWVINDVIQISYIRVAIFVLALLFLGLLLFILKRTRLGLEVRAVTQNPRMAASMGISPDRIKMMTFGLGSGIAGIAGVAIGLYAKVTSEMGSDYIVQSFMTVVVGGVGNVWGTLAGAGMIGSLQKFIEWLYPSNTLAAQTYMILFIILFIQFRPKGIVALKGRAAGD